MRESKQSSPVKQSPHCGTAISGCAFFSAPQLHPFSVTSSPHLTTFRMNTCRSVSKQTALSPFRIRTYEKPGGRGLLLLTRIPKKGFYPEAVRCCGRPSDLSSYPMRIAVLRSIATILDSVPRGKHLSGHATKDVWPESARGGGVEGPLLPLYYARSATIGAFSHD